MPRTAPKHHYVYLLRSTRHYYIGVRSCICMPEDDPYMGSGVALRDAKAAGVEFDKTILCVLDTREEAFELESELVGEDEVADPQCLNLKTGGHGCIHYGDESRRKMSQSQLGRKHPPEVRRKLSEIHKGRKQSPETVAARMKNWDGEAHSEKMKGNQHLKGHRHSAETRAKMRASRLAHLARRKHDLPDED